MLKRILSGAGALALALALSACGSTPGAPTVDATTVSGTAAAVAPTIEAVAPTVEAAAPTIAAQATTIAAAAASDPRFSTLNGLLETTGLSDQLAQAGPYTVFAPTNEAFAALPAGTLEALAQDPQLLQEILMYHVAQGSLDSNAVANTTSADTLAGEPLQISAEGGTVMLNDTATVVQPDIMVGNGVIHVIDEVLLPPNVSLPSGG